MRIAELLDTFSPIEPVAEKWEDVLRRVELIRDPEASRSGETHRRRMLRRPLPAAFAALAVVAVVTPALGIGLPAIGFGTSELAPPTIQTNFESLDRGAPRDFAPSVSADARRVTSVLIGATPHTLYVAPTAKGGFCFEWSDAFGGCDRLGTTLLAVTQGTDYVGGHTTAAVAKVRITFSEGPDVEPALTRIGEPINAAFFLYDAGSARRPTSVVAEDANGKVVARDSLGRTSPTTHAPEFAVMSKATVLIKVESSDGVATVYTAPSSTGGRCAWLTDFRGEVRPLFNQEGCVDQSYRPEGVAIATLRYSHSVLVFGAAGSSYGSLDVDLPDEKLAVHPTSEGVILAALSQTSTKYDHIRIVLRRTDGSKVATFDSAVVDAPM